MDPDHPGVPLPISSLSVQASTWTGSASFSASQNLSNTNRYSLVVEAGTWRYGIYITAYVPRYGCEFYWQFQSIPVAENETVTKDFETDAFLDVRMNVLNEVITHFKTGAGCYLNPSNYFSIRAGVGYLTGNRVVLPAVATTGYRLYEVYVAGRVLGEGADYMDQLEPNTNVVVNAGQTVPVVFNIEPGYIGGTITVIGATVYTSTSCPKRDERRTTVMVGRGHSREAIH